MLHDSHHGSQFAKYEHATLIVYDEFLKGDVDINL